jgi:hypothetical protein
MKEVFPRLINRRNFVRSSAGFAAGFSLLPIASMADDGPGACR